MPTTEGCLVITMCMPVFTRVQKYHVGARWLRSIYSKRRNGLTTTCEYKCAASVVKGAMMKAPGSRFDLDP